MDLKKLVQVNDDTGVERKVRRQKTGEIKLHFVYFSVRICAEQFSDLDRWFSFEKSSTVKFSIDHLPICEGNLSRTLSVISFQNLQTESNLYT